MGEIVDYEENCIGFCCCTECGWCADQNADIEWVDLCPDCGAPTDLWTGEDE